MLPSRRSFVAVRSDGARTGTSRRVGLALTLVKRRLWKLRSFGTQSDTVVSYSLGPPIPESAGRHFTAFLRAWLRRASELARRETVPRVLIPARLRSRYLLAC